MTTPRKDRRRQPDFSQEEAQRLYDEQKAKERERMRREFEALDLTPEQRENQRNKRGCQVITDNLKPYYDEQTKNLEAFTAILDGKGILKHFIGKPEGLTRETLLAMAEATDWEKLNRQVDGTAARLDKAVKPYMFPASSRGMKKIEEAATGNRKGDVKLLVYEVQKGHTKAVLNMVLPFESEPSFGPNLFKTYKLTNVYAYCEKSLYAIMRKQDISNRLNSTHEETTNYLRTIFSSFWTEPGTWEMGHLYEHIFDLGRYVAVKLSPEWHTYLQARIEGREPLPKYEPYGIEAGGRKNALQNILLRYKPTRYHETPAFLVRTLLTKHIGLTALELRTYSKKDLAAILDTNLKSVADTWKLTSEGTIYETFAALGEKPKRSDFLKVKVRFVKIEAQKLVKKHGKAPKTEGKKPKIETPSPGLFEGSRGDDKPQSKPGDLDYSLLTDSTLRENLTEEENAAIQAEIREKEEREAKAHEEIKQMVEQYEKELAELKANKPKGKVEYDESYEYREALRNWDQKIQLKQAQIDWLSKGFNEEEKAAIKASAKLKYEEQKAELQAEAIRKEAIRKAAMQAEAIQELEKLEKELADHTANKPKGEEEDFEPYSNEALDYREKMRAWEGEAQWLRTKIRFQKTIIDLE
jgi:hypothetical protein